MVREDDKCVVLSCGATRGCSEQWLQEFQFVGPDDFRSVGFTDAVPSPLLVSWLDSPHPCTGMSREYLSHGNVADTNTANVRNAGCLVFFLDTDVVEESTSTSSPSSSSSSGSGGVGGGGSTSMTGQVAPPAPPPSPAVAAMQSKAGPSSTNPTASTPPLRLRPGVAAPATLQNNTLNPAPPPPVPDLAQTYFLVRQNSAILPTIHAYIWEGPGLETAGQTGDLLNALRGVHRSEPTDPDWRLLTSFA